MKRWTPKSLIGQMAVLIGIALLLAQLAGFAFVILERQQFNRAEIDTPAVTRFTSTAADFIQATPDFQSLVLNDASRRGAHYEIASAPLVRAGSRRRSDTEERMRQSLSSAGVSVTDVRATIDSHASSRRRGGTMLLSAQLSDKRWINARLPVPAPPRLVTPELWVGTVLVYLFVLAAAVSIATRLARPLRNLATAADAFHRGTEQIAVNPAGPSDLRNAILAFNAMNERVVKLLEEKDRTLGAIGHDLRTPLASLRIRAELVEPPEDRERMISTIEEMTATLEDILTLARSGRSAEPRERIDVGDLVRTLEVEYHELGHPLTVSSKGAAFVTVQPNLLKRAIRNLADNAIKYGGEAAIEVSGADPVQISVQDRGPGLSQEDLAKVTDAFYRGEPSRNRETGGAGLGLAIAKAIVDAQGGTLTLAKRQTGGLSATICLSSNARELRLTENE